MNIPSAIIVEPRKETDYIRGLSTGIVPQVNIADGNWSQFLQKNEPQKFAWESNGCTTFSCLHCITTQLNWFKATGKMSGQALKWFTDNGYLDENGLFNLSERFTGALAGTSINGNTLYANWDSVRKNGILPQKDFDYTMEMSNRFSSQDAMCKDMWDKGQITQAMKDKALKSLSFIKISWEWVSQNVSKTEVSELEEALKQAPVQIGVPVEVPGWNNVNVLPVTRRNPDHAIELYDELGGSWYIFDDYNPWRKILDKAYFIPQAILGVVTLIPQDPFQDPAWQDVSATSTVDSWPQNNRKILSTFLSSLKAFLLAIISDRN